MDDHQAVVYSCLAVAVSVAVCIYVVRWYNDPLRTIPTVGGPSLPGLSYLSALRLLGDSRDVLVKAYKKYPDSVFKVAALDKWIVVLSGRSMVDELRKFKEEELSSPRGFEEAMQTWHTMEPAIFADTYHIEAVKETFMRKLQTVLPPVLDEIAVAVKDNFGATRDDWTSIDPVSALQMIITRAVNRAFVGLPLCRNEKYLALAIQFAAGLGKSGLILRLSPRFLQPLVAKFINPLYIRGDTHRVLAYLQPIIEERQKAMAKLGEGWDDKPNDLLQSFLDRVATRNETTFVITQRLLNMNFAAIHTSSATLSHALYHLAEKPELVAAFREEIETAIAEDGWTAPAFGKMWKLDSLLRETLRYYGVSLLALSRLAMKDVALSDGTRIPRGTMVLASTYAMHHDSALLGGADSDAFDAFRFARMRAATRADAEGQGQGTRHLFTSTSPEYMSFGHGQHACPGRFFAAHQLKAILAHVLLDYDMKLGGDGARPPAVYFAMSVAPAPARGRVLFRKRLREEESV